MAAPVKTENVEYSHVQNNGHAMAPYMMSVGLFVACIAFTVMYPLMEKNEEVKNGFQWWLSKAGVMAVISVLQAVVMVGVLMGVNGMRPDYVGKTFGMAILASMAFMAMICFFEMFINRIGSYLVLVFMVLQLGAAAGTYPLDMAPKFYKILHNFMPFTYTVHAFRQYAFHGWSNRTGCGCVCRNFDCVYGFNNSSLSVPHEEKDRWNFGDRIVKVISQEKKKTRKFFEFPGLAVIKSTQNALEHS